ncbi:TonB-dependent receptor domain-containing protein [Rasiella sp. SM2506]|uniref:TonB-dependent receptor domain-containing protein n=1 Tax=Rasiella sp. SM2506 TaxID=3423914 RepID=UPI003D7C1068
MYRKRTVFTLLCLCFWCICTSQIKGTVVSANGIPVVAVQIQQNDSIVAITDENGIFKLSKEISFPVPLLLSHPGYFTEEVLFSKNDQVFQLTKILEINALNTVLLSSTYQRESRVLIPTETIREEMIARFTPVDLVDAVNQTPGVYIQNGAINTNRITIRGVGSRTLYGTNKIRAYYNGIPITNGAGETNIDLYDPTTISNLEIVKGPKATQYGTNLGGTLILSTKEFQRDGITTQNTFTVGSFGLLKNSVNFQVKDKKLSLSFNYHHVALEGYRENSTYNRNGYVLNTDYRFTETFTLGLLLQHTNNFAQIASSISKTAFAENPTQAAFTWAQAQGFEDNRETLVGLRFQNKITESFSNTTTIFYRYLDHYEPRPFNILDEITNGYGARTIFAKEFNFSERNATVSFGAEGYTDEYRWKTIENRYEENQGNGSLPGAVLSRNKELRNQLNVFATTILPLTQKLSTEVGINYNTTSYTYTDAFTTGVDNKSASRDFKSIWAPNLNVLYKASPAWSLFGNISRGFNYPSIEETLTPEGVINPNIGPEIGWNYELGTVTDFFEKSLTIQATAYLLSIKDLLVAERVGDDQFIGRNAGKTEHKGIELSILYKFQLLPQLSVYSYGNAEFTFHKFLDFVDGDQDFSGNDLTGVPDRKITAGIELKHTSGWFLLGNLLHVGSQPITDSNSLYSDAYTLGNIKAGYEMLFTEVLRVKVSGGINNITNATYASSILINASAFGNNEPRYFYPGNARNYYGSIALGYTF